VTDAIDHVGPGIGNVNSQIFGKFRDVGENTPDLRGEDIGDTASS
jgi:hypothetical protein